MCVHLVPNDSDQGMGGMPPTQGPPRWDLWLRLGLSCSCSDYRDSKSPAELADRSRGLREGTVWGPVILLLAS